MLRKLPLAIAATLIASGAALAAPRFAVQPTPTVPGSMSETGPNYPAPTMAAARVTGSVLPRDVQGPTSVSESMPEMTGGLAHPTHTGATRAARPLGAIGGGAPASAPIIDD